MPNNVLMRKVVVTDAYQPLTAASTVVTVTVSALPSNAGPVYFKGDDPGAPGDVPWIPGEWHEFRSVDLAEIEIKGTPGDVVTVVGGTW